MNIHLSTAFSVCYYHLLSDSFVSYIILWSLLCLCVCLLLIGIYHNLCCTKLQFEVLLPPLYELVMEIEQKDIKGGQLLNLLHKRCHCGVPELQSCIQRYNFTIIYKCDNLKTIEQPFWFLSCFAWKLLCFHLHCSYFAAYSQFSCICPNSWILFVHFLIILF